MASGMQSFKDPKNQDAMSDNASSVGARELYVFILLARARALSLYQYMMSDIVGARELCVWVKERESARARERRRDGGTEEKADRG